MHSIRISDNVGREADSMNMEALASAVASIEDNKSGMPPDSDRSAGTRKVPKWCRLMGKIRTLSLKKRYGEAIEACEKALRAAEKQHGNEDIAVARHLIILASLHVCDRLFEKAEALYKRALEIIVKQRGSEHEDVAMVLLLMASCYCDQKSYAEAESLAARSLAVCRKTLGPRQPCTAMVMWCLAQLYWKQNKVKQAKALEKRAQAIIESSICCGEPLGETDCLYELICPGCFGCESARFWVVSRDEVWYPEQADAGCETQREENR